MSEWVAIDFGTSNCTAAVEVNGEIVPVRFINNDTYYPTVAHISSRGEITTGVLAKPYLINDSDNYLQKFKTEMDSVWRMNGVGYRDVVADILQNIREAAKREDNGHDHNKALITVPVSFTNASPKREILQEAAHAAGFTAVEFLEEPKAAAYHYVYVTRDRGASVSLIYDLGGGTFDAALVQTDSSGNLQFVGIPVGSACGGLYFDADIYEKAAAELNLNSEDQQHTLHDMEQCCSLKVHLSMSDQGVVGLSGGEFRLTKTQFQELIDRRLANTIEACNRLLGSAEMQWSDLDRILFVGGSTSIPLVREKLHAHLIAHGAERVPILRNEHSYNHLLAVSFGGIAYIENLLSPPMPPLALMCYGNDRFHLQEGCNTFGRAADNDCVVATDTRMSRYHFRIEVQPKTDKTGYDYLLTDCKSSNGTVVGNTLCLNPKAFVGAPCQTFLKIGDTVRAGNTCFTLMLPENGIV